MGIYRISMDFHRIFMGFHRISIVLFFYRGADAV